MTFTANEPKLGAAKKMILFYTKNNHKKKLSRDFIIRIFH